MTGTSPAMTKKAGKRYGLALRRAWRLRAREASGRYRPRDGWVTVEMRGKAAS